MLAILVSCVLQQFMGQRGGEEVTRVHMDITEEVLGKDWKLSKSLAFLMQRKGRCHEEWAMSGIKGDS